jgi:hypothetical protein
MPQVKYLRLEQAGVNIERATGLDHPQDANGSTRFSSEHQKMKAAHTAIILRPAAEQSLQNG